MINIPPKDQLAEAISQAARESEMMLPVDTARLVEAQKEVVLGRLLWRLDPVEVIKRDAPSRYQFTETAIYHLTSKDPSAGSASVRVERSGSAFTVHLIQPIEKGAQGVWAIEKIIGKP